MSAPHLPGPDRETLEKLRTDLPGMIDDVDKRRQFCGKKSAKLALPSKCCAVCGRGFSPSMISTGMPEISLCPHCHNHLSDGNILFVSDNRFAVVSPKNSKGEIAPGCEALVGRIVHITVDQMDTFQLRLKFQSEEKHSAESRSLDGMSL